MIATLINAEMLKPLVSEEGRRHLKKLSIAVVVLSLLATAVFFSGGLGLPIAAIHAVNIIGWGVLPSIVGLWQMYANIYDLMNERTGPPCKECGQLTHSIV